jgi:hypothetical protein
LLDHPSLVESSARSKTSTQFETENNAREAI